MKRIITLGLLTVALSLVSVGAFAQDNGNRDANNKIVRGPYQTNRFGDNWFIEAGAGMTAYLGGQNTGGFGKRLRPVFDFGLGKWITPSVGVRLQFNYSPQMRQYSVSHNSPYAQWGTNADGASLQKFNFMNLHADFMWNLSNAIGGYKQNRIYSVIPYVGIGGSRIKYDGAPRHSAISFSAGIINKFCVSKSVDINLELRSTMIKGNFDLSNLNNKVDVPVALTAGITLRLGKVKGFKRAQLPIPADYTSYNNRIKELENNNNSLTNTNSKLAKENDELRNRKQPAAEVAVSASPVALFFGLDKATLNSKEKTNLEFYVKNAIKADKNKIFTLIGSADSATGSKTGNQKLSEQRMQYVYDLLVNKYGISKERLQMKAEGDTNNRFAEPRLNRAVIVE